MTVLMIIINSFSAGPAVTSAMVSPAACVERAELVAAQVRAGEVIVEAFEGRVEPAEKAKRRALLDQYMTSAGILLGKGRADKSKNYLGHAAYQVGREAGRNASIRDGVTGEPAPKLIGRA